MQKTFPQALLLAGALLASASASAVPTTTYTYNKTFTQTCTSGCTGNMSANATIVTDALGSLSIANIVDWNIVLTSPSNPSFTLTPANSTKNSSGSVLLATASNLTFSFPDELNLFSFDGTAAFPAVYNFVMQGDRFLFTNTPNMMNLMNQASSSRTAPWSLSFPVQSGSVPEPATLGLVLTGLAAGAWNRRRSQGIA